MVSRQICALPRPWTLRQGHRESRLSGPLDTDRICYLAATSEVVDLKTNRVSTLWRKLAFAIVQRIKQQASLELVSSFRIGKAINETLDSYFFGGKSNGCHDRPPKSQHGSESLAVLTNDSSGFRRQPSSIVVSYHWKCTAWKKVHDKPSWSSITYFADLSARCPYSQARDR